MASNTPLPPPPPAPPAPPAAPAKRRSWAGTALLTTFIALAGLGMATIFLFIMMISALDGDQGWSWVGEFAFGTILYLIIPSIVIISVRNKRAAQKAVEPGPTGSSVMAQSHSAATAKPQNRIGRLLGVGALTLAVCLMLPIVVLGVWMLIAIL